WRDRRGTAVLADDPRRELSGARVSGHEHAVVYVAVGAVRALDPPGGVVADLDLRLGDEIADLPGRPVAVALDLEIRRHAEVALAAGPRPGVAPGAANPARAGVLPPPGPAGRRPRPPLLGPPRPP